MASSKKNKALRDASLLQNYLHGLNVAVRGNAQAFGFSILITVSYGIVAASADKPSALELTGFALSAVAAFSLLNVLVTLLKPIQRDDQERSIILLVATATDFLAVGAGLGVAFAVVTLTDGALRWALTPFLAALTYALVQALELTLTRESADKAD